MIPSHWRRPFSSPFPNPAQTKVLTAIFAAPNQARAAFQSWRAEVELEAPFDAEVFRLLPPLYLRAKELGITDDLMPRLKGVYRHAWVTSLYLLHETRPAVAALEQAGVPTLMLKGAPLALTTYSTLAARPMGDCDVAVPTERLLDAIRVLEAGDWTSPGMSLGASSISHGARFCNARGGEFDLHWHVLPETVRNPVEDRFWETARSCDFDGIATRMLDPALALLHALIHGLRSNPVPPVRWVADGLTLIRHSTDLDWDLLVHVARAARVTQRVQIGITYLAQHFAADVPSRAIEALRASTPGLMERAETAAVLFETRGLVGNAVTKPMIMLADYVRQANERGLRRIPGFFRYARRRLGMTSVLGSA
jgi:Uncharacterised nucleotidyltransferase